MRLSEGRLCKVRVRRGSRAAKTEIWEQVQEHGLEEEHGERKSWRLKMAGEGSDDWAPLEADLSRHGLLGSF